MHHVTLDTWGRLASPLHRVDARAKILAVFAILLALALTRRGYPALFLSYFLLISTMAVLARLPLPRLLLRAAAVLPFAGTIALLSFFGGDAARGAAVLGKSYLSALAVLLLLGTTTVPALLRGLESLGVPRFFLMIAQFVYRYLFVLSEQAQHMIQARRCRASGRSAAASFPGSSPASRAAPFAAPVPRRQLLLRSAAGALAVLFARSYARAERVHQAMLARGFRGHFVLVAPASLSLRDAAFLILSLGAVAAVQVTLWIR